jgi:cyclopropane fatty-acyl-phospholipid synthase-like methyltransferase
MKEMWDERYGQVEFAYGEEPNVFLKEQLVEIEPGMALFPAEGEGRNAVYTASLGWKIDAFDLSEEGKQKALKLANLKKTQINYQVGEFQQLGYKNESFDLIALIYAHFPANNKSEYHKELSNYLKKGGLIIFEAFSKSNLEYVSKNPKIGGPKDINMLFSIDEINADFENFEIELFEEKEIELREGLYHNGIGSVIRFVGRKK